MGESRRLQESTNACRAFGPMGKQHPEMIASRRQKWKPIIFRKRLLRSVIGIVPPVPDHDRKIPFQHRFASPLKLANSVETGAHAGLDVSGDPLDQPWCGSFRKYHESVIAHRTSAPRRETVARMATTHDQ